MKKGFKKIPEIFPFGRSVKKHSSVGTAWGQRESERRGGFADRCFDHGWRRERGARGGQQRGRGNSFGAVFAFG